MMKSGYILLAFLCIGAKRRRRRVNMNTETIAAIATGLSNSGISIIRISGEDAFKIADKCFKAMSGKSIYDIKSYSLNYGHIVDDGVVIDEVLLSKMKAPKTYTREDVIEINCHGGIVVTKRVLETVLKYGARPAEPGEFTKRAFLNGRIDLSQAEAVIDIINAKNNLALKNSISQLKGNVRNKIADLREKLLRNTAFIEAALDDPEHISIDGFSEELESEVKEVKAEIKKLIDSADNGKIIKEGVKTVILGKPNSGKSSLLNLILGEDRAIVTDIAGTTRDTLEETIQFEGIVLNIVDTAGIRKTENEVEKIGVEKAKETAGDADLIIYVMDSSVDNDENDREIIDIVKNKKIIILLNKCDLNVNTDVNETEKEYGAKTILFSAKTGEGLDELKSEIKDMFYNGEINFDDEIYITNVRQKNLLKETEECLNNVLNSIEAGMPEDFFSIDLMDAYTKLGIITGDDVEDDLADKIFSEFCMGK